ncbi:hypothetical protein Tco_0877019 [Tanacetum coccineum]|uniref:Uncharacterized protein n=1 Tax=Tanacetum coccineum TaxID=301880 RepID=A0ABQ5BX45_9ASTR
MFLGNSDPNLANNFLSSRVKRTEFESSCRRQSNSSSSSLLSSYRGQINVGKDDFFAIRFPFRRVFFFVVVVVVKICSGVIWGKYCGAKGNWPDGNWPDGNWEELPIEFCEDGVDGLSRDD